MGIQVSLGHVGTIILMDRSSAMSGAYIYGWMIIETVIDRIWEEYVTDLSLKYSTQWTTQHKTEVLFASGKIDPKHRNLLMELRKKRNDILPEKETIGPEEAFKCLRRAAVTATNRIAGYTDIFRDPKEKQFEEALARIREKIASTS